MPQLDKLSFATQIFWLLVVFFFMYVILLRYILPNIYKILKIRKEILESLTLDSTRLADEEYIARTVHKELFSVSIFKTVDFLKHFQKKSNIFKNICNVFILKSQIFTKVREQQKETVFVLKLKKNIIKFFNV